MIFTLGDARDFVYRYVDGGGVCKTSSRVRDVVNEAQMILLDAGDWKNTEWRMLFHIQNNCICCPREISSLRAVNFEEYPGRIWSQHYEFLDGGYGSEDVTGTCDKDLIDLGAKWPTFNDIDYTNPNKIIALSTEEADVGKTIHVRGITTNKELVHTNGVVGEELAIGRWVDGIEGKYPDAPVGVTMQSENIFYGISQIIKPQTVGYVTLYAYDSGTPKIWFLGKYHPLEKQPGYRKYRVINHDYTNGDCMIGMGKLTYVPMYDDNDMLLIQNLPAIKAMVMAIAAGDAGNADADSAMMQKSEFFLARQKDNENTTEPELQMEGDTYFGGDVESMI